MPKKVLRDILPPPEKSIRDIPLPKKNNNSPQENDVLNEKEENRIIGLPPKYERAGSRYLGWIIAIVLILLFFSLPLLWSTANIKVKTKSLNHDFKKDLVAVKEKDGIGIPFEVLNYSKELESKLPATGEEDAERKASGEIIIFNKYSTNSQNLIRNTRFETPEGLIYRIDNTVTVPGADSKNGELIPGQLKVRVYADFPGNEYNIGLTDFTIPGFKGLPQFDEFFARSETEMTGGFIGKVGVINDEVLESTRSELRASLEDSIKDEILEKVSKSFILLPPSLKMTFESLPQDDQSGQTVVVKEKATASAVILDKKALEDEIILSALSNKSADVIVPNLETLNFSLDDQEKVQDSNIDIEHFNFSMVGTARLVWILEEDALKRDLAGKSKKVMGEILSSKYPSVIEAVSSIKPFWKRTFPNNIERIKIEINPENQS